MEIIDVRDQMPTNPDPAYVYKTRKLKKIKQLVLHCDDMDADLMDIAHYDIAPNHISSKGCPGFTYHFFVEKDGRVFHCMDLTKTTWHVGNHNGNSVGICLRYRATGNLNPPPTIQLQAACSLFRILCLDLCIDPDNIKGHRELLGTGYEIKNGVKKLRKTCPGMLVNMDFIRYTVSMSVQTHLKKLGYYKAALDGQFGPLSEKALKEYYNKVYS